MRDDRVSPLPHPQQQKDRRTQDAALCGATSARALITAL
jgi:hypothetical protein